MNFDEEFEYPAEENKGVDFAAADLNPEIKKESDEVKPKKQIWSYKSENLIENKNGINQLF